jgi:hypothetical protein
MPTVELDEQEWQAVLAMIALAPWRDANPLLMKIGSQLRIQQIDPVKQPATPSKDMRRDGKEIRHE